jgi:predicted nucleic acid-binding protein
LNYFSTAGQLLRANACAIIGEIEKNPSYRIFPISPQLFREARKMYERHSDKAWSLTDCSSFLLMRELGIQNALTFDHHFEQAGFRTIPGI